MLVALSSLGSKCYNSLLGDPAIHPRRRNWSRERPGSNFAVAQAFHQESYLFIQHSLGFGKRKTVPKPPNLIIYSFEDIGKGLRKYYNEGKRYSGISGVVNFNLVYRSTQTFPWWNQILFFDGAKGARAQIQRWATNRRGVLEDKNGIERGVSVSINGRVFYFVHLLDLVLTTLRLAINYTLPTRILGHPDMKIFWSQINIIISMEVKLC